MRTCPFFFLFLLFSVVFLSPIALAKKSKFQKPKKNIGSSNRHSHEERNKKSGASSGKSPTSADEKGEAEFQKKCKSAVPNNFTPAQATEFCSGVSNKKSLSCVKDSRSGSVKLSFEEITTLCKGTVHC